MPYTKAQCQAFGARADRGEDVPSDWKEQCSKEVVQDKGKASYQDMNEKEKMMDMEEDPTKKENMV